MDNSMPKKGFVWYSLRISFWIILVYDLLFLIAVLSPPLYDSSTDTTEPSTFISSLYLFLFFITWSPWVIVFVLSIFNIVISIIHLTKYKEKTLAIVSLIASILFIAFSIWLGSQFRGA